MKYFTYKQINDTTTLYKSEKPGGADFVLVEKAGEGYHGTYYDVTIFWSDSESKRVFFQAQSKQDFINNPEGISEALEDNVIRFPCNADLGWMDQKFDDWDRKLLDMI